MRLFSFFRTSQLRLLRLPVWTTITILFVGCNKDSESYFFFCKILTELEIRYTLLRVCSTNSASLVSPFYFSTSLMKESMITIRLQYYINSTHALFLAVEVTCFFFFTLFNAHTFLILILQTASYTHACWLTLISGGYGVLWSTRVLHPKLKRPRTRSNRLGPDPDPADHLKYRPKPGSGPGSSGPPWRLLGPAADRFLMLLHYFHSVYLLISQLLYIFACLMDAFYFWAWFSIVTSESGI